jgi:tripartite-type tricarboxylate transporter receptor subunit TctC
VRFLVPFIAGSAPDVIARQVAELVAPRLGQPVVIENRCGAGGNGSGAHLAAELLRVQAELQVVHVPYRGAPDIIRAVLAHEVSFGLPTLATATQLVRAGQLRALAHTGGGRSPVLPDVPTLADTFPGFELTSWFGFVAPAGTPAEAPDRMDQAIRAALADPAFRDRTTADGTIAVGMGAAEFAAFLRAEQARWAEAVPISGARVD